MGTASETGLPDTYPGQHFCRTMQASVDSILLPLGIRREVVSSGTEFKNRDAWTGEAFAHQLCAHFTKSPSALPSRDELRTLLTLANSIVCPEPFIQVARMPDRVSYRVALAIIGGGYHEAWHTRYSKRDPVKVTEALSILDHASSVLRVGGVFDAKTRGLLLTLHHLIEDIRIERRGIEDYPGTLQPMHDLQDFILDLETSSRETSAAVKNITVSSNARSIMLCCFRDLGLGYNTERARATMAMYKRTAPAAVAMLSPGGCLEATLEEAIGLAAEDTMGSFRLAMRAVAVLWAASKKPKADNAGSHEGCCPKCGAAPPNLVVRPYRDTRGVKVRGKGEVECSVCGFTMQIDLPDTSLDLAPEKVKPEKPSPKNELSPEDVGADADGFGDDTHEHMRDAPKKDPSRKEMTLEGLIKLGGKLRPLLDKLGDPKPQILVSGNILQGEDEESGLNNLNALGHVMAQHLEAEQRDVQRGERFWNPKSPHEDVARCVTTRDQTVAMAKAALWFQSLAQEIGFLRAQFRSKFIAQEMLDTVHGLRKGRRLSSRMLVDSRIDLRAGRMPSRAYQDIDECPNMSVAVAVCADESGSMRPIKQEIAKIMMLILDPVSKIGGATMAFGFRSKGHGGFTHEYHRLHSVVYDVFKTWEERFENVRWRVTETKAEGSTPMSDGVQYGVTALNERTEMHRFLLVLTDGDPDAPHTQVITRQLRLAKEAGIHVVGVGITEAAKYVEQLFPDHVWARSIEELPAPLMRKMIELCDFSGKSRGKKVRLDSPQRMVRRVLNV